MALFGPSAISHKPESSSGFSTNLPRIESEACGMARGWAVAASAGSIAATHQNRRQPEFMLQ